MFTGLASLGSMALGGLGTAGSWLGSTLGTAGSWIGSNLGGIGQALGGLGGAVGGLLGTSSSSKQARKLARYQAALNWQYQKKAWLEGYGYQRQGLEDAGYNPMLALGGASSNAYTGGSLPSAPVPDIVGSAKQGGEFLKAISQLTKLEVQQKEAIIDNIESSTLKNNVGTIVGGVSDASRVVADVAAASAISKAVKTGGKPNKKAAVFKEVKKVREASKKAGKGASGVLNSLSKVVPVVLPMVKGSAIGAAGIGAAYGAYKAVTYPHKKGSNAKKLADTPNYGSRLR